MLQQQSLVMVVGHEDDRLSGGRPPPQVYTHVEAEGDHHCQKRQALDKVRLEYVAQHVIVIVLST